MHLQLFALNIQPAALACLQQLLQSLAEEALLLQAAWVSVSSEQVQRLSRSEKLRMVRARMIRMSCREEFMVANDSPGLRSGHGM
jgi:protein gp37